MIEALDTIFVSLFTPMLRTECAALIKAIFGLGIEVTRWREKGRKRRHFGLVHKGFKCHDMFFDTL